MANPELAIAKASFSAILFRKEPVSLTRPEIESFHTLLHDAIHQCSPANVQKCKRWILENLVPSPARVAALGKYLAALSNSFPDEAKTKPSTRRRRLHILYVLHDVLYHAVVRDRDARFATELEASLTPLLYGAAKFRNCPKHTKKVEDLLVLWEKHKYFSPTSISGFRETIIEAPNGRNLSKAVTQDQTGSNLGSKLPKDAPYMIPSIHGDPNTPWFDLPAANWLPHLTPNSTKPMNPDMIKPLQLAPGPADKALANAVKDLLVDVERLYSKSATSQTANSQQHMDLSEMGERIVLDEITGEVVDGETYYGWSRRFCEKMKQRRKKAKRGDDSRGRGRSDSRSRSRSRSRSYSPGRSSRSNSSPAFKRLVLGIGVSNADGTTPATVHLDRGRGQGLVHAIDRDQDPVIEVREETRAARASHPRRNATDTIWTSDQGIMTGDNRTTNHHLLNLPVIPRRRLSRRTLRRSHRLAALVTFHRPLKVTRGNGLRRRRRLLLIWVAPTSTQLVSSAGFWCTSTAHGRMDCSTTAPAASVSTVWAWQRRIPRPRGKGRLRSWEGWMVDV
ncbi:uncharacterized protein ColSpa_01112 [Colletotrichum spaethianum]|uniref:CID domain-containing protein n=1 Tax=Colletotrichum spaethianum TaxID=700344 RepID=A0AA37L2S9_9PEZI|nr:uncharacterized protein ColSpa_01112 [Colletotrichum spaethianum]GKT40931.1 hypothetical protein ColSpa_01112 [Colletotrichum spaethianum]